MPAFGNLDAFAKEKCRMNRMSWTHVLGTGEDADDGGGCRGSSCPWAVTTNQHSQNHWTTNTGSVSTPARYARRHRWETSAGYVTRCSRKAVGVSPPRDLSTT